MMSSVAVGDVVKTPRGTGTVLRVVPDNKDTAMQVLYKVKFPNHTFAYFWACELVLVQGLDLESKS